MLTLQKTSNELPHEQLNYEVKVNETYATLLFNQGQLLCEDAGRTRAFIHLFLCTINCAH